MRLPFAREALPFAAPLIVLALIGLLAGGWPWAVVPLIAVVAVLGFFRDPERSVPLDPRAIVAAADGRVTDTDPAWPGDDHLPAGPRVGVFLSVLNVHINRMPLDGEVIQVLHRPGKFLNALRPESAHENESNLVCVRRGEALFGVKQITGAIARRIVCHCKPGDRVVRGERFGMIRFGSRTEHYLPAGSEIAVKAGDRVVGGETIIGWLPESN